MSATMFCGRCGAPLAAGSTVCANCGTPVAAVAAQSPAVGAVTGAVAHHAKVSPSVWIGAAGVVAVLAVVLAIVAFVAGPKKAAICNVPCPIPPPTSPPLAAARLYTSAAYGYSLEYYDSILGVALGTPSVMDDRSVGWMLTTNDGLSWPSTFTGQPATGMTAQQEVDAIHAAKFSDAALAFQLPDAGLGYNAGAGSVYDYTFRTSGGTSAPARLLIVASVRNGLAVYLVAIGPIDSNWAAMHPNPSETVVGVLMSPLENGIAFPGDAPK